MKRKRRAADVGEWGLLRALLPRLNKGLSDRVVVKPGDDAAAVKLDGLSVVTTDMLVEGVHFRLEWTSGADLGHKALAVNLSDLAAMGNVRPAYAVVALGITAHTPVDFVDGFYRGLRALADRHGCEIVGGDTVRSERIVVSIAAVGRASSKKDLLLRSGARPGDVLMVTGTLGDAAAGLDLLRRRRPRLKATDAVFLARRLRRPEPRLALAQRIFRTARPHAMIDCSDGLRRSVLLLCEASGSGARVDMDRLPLSPALRRWARAAGRPAAETALAGGEDYELVLAAAPAAARRLEAADLARAAGRFTAKREGVRFFEKGKVRNGSRGFEHFG